MARKALTIIALIVVFVLIAPAAGLLSIQAITGANTVTQQIKSDGWLGKGTFAGKGEVLDAPAYVGGFKSDGQSEKIVMQGFLVKPEINCARPNNVVQRVWFKSLSGTYPVENTVTPAVLPKHGGGNVPSPEGYVLLHEDYVKDPTGTALCPSEVRLDGVISTVKGNFIGIIRAEVWSTLDGIFLRNSGHYSLFAADEATVQPGWGHVEVLNADSLVEVGETLTIHYDVGAACSVAEEGDKKCGWILTVRNRAGGTPPGWTDKTLSDFSEGDISVKVTSGWFVLGERNEYEVNLFNQVNRQDAKTFVTIDDKTLAPGKPVVTLTPPPYRQGDLITMGLSSTPNPTTKEPIQDFHVIVRQGDRTLLDTIVPATDGKATTSFSIADEQVDIQVEATAFDGLRTSGVTRMKLVVLDTDLDSNKPNGPGSFPLWLIPILIGVVLLLVLFFVPFPWLSLPWKLILLIVGVTLIVAGFLLIGKI